MNSAVTAAAEPSDATFAVLIGASLGLLIAVFAIAILWYVFAALGYYKLAKNRGITYAWIAWIPICQDYLLGDLIGNKVWGFGYANWILVIGTLIMSIISPNVSANMNTFLLVVLAIFAIAFFVYRMTALYKLFQIYKPQSATLYLVLSVIFQFLIPIFVFLIRNNEPQPLREKS